MSAEDKIRNFFPKLKAQPWRVTSKDTKDYNCLAWAAGETHRRWDLDRNYYWPEGVPREQTISAFVAAYETRGFVECENGDLEHGYEKIAIYAINGRPQHAARQLGNGAWTSKLGDWWDIEHATVEGVESNSYGDVAVFMKRVILFRGGIQREERAAQR
jgi:hypothetical protein